MMFEEKYSSCHILLPDQISLSGCLYFVRYWAICVLKLFLNQVATSHLETKEFRNKPYLSNEAVLSTIEIEGRNSISMFLHGQKRLDKNLNFLRTKRAFKVK